MKKKISSASLAESFYLIWTLALAVLCLIFLVLGNRSAVLGTLFWATVILGLFLCRPGSGLHRVTMDDLSSRYEKATVIVIILVVAMCILPMADSPLWNGEVPGHRNQYELMAEALLDGRISLEYGDEAGLLALENPYDPQQRTDSGVTYHWDHAWYNGNYYMYFGIVPVLLVFLPFRVLTGVALTTYHATQLFAGLTILGIFFLLRLLAKQFFPKLSYGVYISTASAFSVVSIWFSIAQPALYCTAITSALCLQVWSLYCFAKAVWEQKEVNFQLRWAALGAILGALVFGCRPTIGLANLLVVPLLVTFLKEHPITPALMGKLFLAALPYALVAAFLMLYNYARFGDPFEFGQTYQLTVADQTNLGDLSDAAVRLRLYNDTYDSFLGLTHIGEKFPFIGHSGVFVNFPMLLLVFEIFREDIRVGMRELKLRGYCACLFLLPFLITLLAVLWSPYLLERYRMDIYFLLCILTFLVIGLRMRSLKKEKRNRFGACIMALSLMTLLTCLGLHMVSVKSFLPMDVDRMEAILFFWKYL